MTTQIFAHRGSSGDYPENTMLAFKHALKDNADGIETDVQLTKDGVPVLIHDETVNRTTDGKGFIKDYTLKDLQSLKAGRQGWRSRNEVIPTLEEFLEWIRVTPLLLNIELKNSLIDYKGLETMVLEMVHHYKMMDRTIFSSFNHESLRKLKKIDAEAETAILYKGKIPEVNHYARALGASGLHPNYRSVNRAFINTMHKEGLAVRPYTINTPILIKRFIKWDANAIFTNYPKRAKKILKSLSK